MAVITASHNFEEQMENVRMLKLSNITKIYEIDKTRIQALTEVDLQFRESEFVAVLGPSGCGKTTLLNIIGGLDNYTSGDLFIGGKSTKSFRDTEWDAYRNSTVGFVFQSYNLISHLSVLDNVAIALTLSGVSAEERKKRAMEALSSVGIADQAAKKPNQLSGGQMQRVAIARALVNNPKILLADEPTGALDSATSVQIMEILKEISKDRLVIMVTHNQELARGYSDRVVRLKDGLITEDTKPTDGEINETRGKLINKKTSMSWTTAINLSFKNLMTKKKRTFLTSIAGSIGIVGVALVLAISSGMTAYVSSMQSDALAGFPITISKTALFAHGGHGADSDNIFGGRRSGQFPTGNVIYSYDSSANTTVHNNVISLEYINYLAGMDRSLYNAVSYTYGLEMTVLAKTDFGSYKKVNTKQSASLFGSSSYFNEIPGNADFVKTQYDILEGSYPINPNEVVLIVDKYNRIDVRVLEDFGITITDSYTFSDMVGRMFKAVSNDDYYTETDGVFIAGTDYESMFNNHNSLSLTIVGIMRVKETASSELLSSGIGYTIALTETMLEQAKSSAVSVAQLKAGETVNVLTGQPFNNLVTYTGVMQQIGADAVPTGIQIYPVNFEAKEGIKNYLDAYNSGKPNSERIIYADLAETVANIVSTLINTIAIVLAAFAAISLVVSTIMIGIITYVSVVERTKEIGILRAIGARKKDITRVFNAETLIIGFIAGLLGVVVTLVLSVPINVLIFNLVGVSGIASLPLLYGALLIIGSMALTLIGGWLPSRGAAKKDPVVALRTE